MIAIASGLSSSLETATATVVKKDGGSTEFAAAFEQVSAKDAEAQGGAKVRAAIVAQGKRVSGGGSNRGQAGVVSGNNSSQRVSIARAAVAKAAGGDAAAESAVAALKVAADTGEAASSAVPDDAPVATKVATAAKLDAADFGEAHTAGQEALARNEARLGEPSVGEKAVPGGISGGSSIGLESPGSTKVAAGPSTLGTSTALPVIAVAAPEIRSGGRELSGTQLSQSTDVVSAAGNASAKAVVAAVPDPVRPRGNSASGDLPSFAPTSQEAVGISGLVAAKGVGSATPLAVTVPAQTPLVTKAGTVVIAEAQQGSGGLQASTAKPRLQESVGTVQGQPVERPVNSAGLVVPQEAVGAIGQQGVNGTPMDATELIGPQQTNAPQAALALEGLKAATIQTAGSVLGPVLASSAVGPQEIVPQQEIAQPVIAQQTVGQQAITPRFSATPHGVVALVAEETVEVAVGSGPTRQGKSQQLQPNQVAPSPAGASQVQNSLVDPPQVETLQTDAEQVASSEKQSAGQQPVRGVSGPAVAVQHAGKPADADKDKKASGIAATASDSGKKVASSSGSSNDANTGVAPIAANASAPALPVFSPFVSSAPAPAAQANTVPGVIEQAKPAAARVDGATNSTVAFPTGEPAASTSKRNTAVDHGAKAVVAQNSGTAAETTGSIGQATTLEGIALTGGLGGAQESTVPGASAEGAAPQTGNVAAGASPASRERKPGAVEGKTVERTPTDTASSAQPIASQHLAVVGPDAAKPSTSSHQPPSEAGTQSLATGTAGLGGGIGAAPLSVTQVRTNGVVAATIAARETQSSSLTSTGGLASTGVAGTESLMSPMAHTTLQATPTVLEVGVPGGTHGWLKIRAEIGEGGTVQASMSAATHEGQETLRRELPAMNAFLDSEHVPVSVQVAAHGLSNTSVSSVLGGDTGFNLGSSLSQDAGSGRSEAGTGLLAGGDGARQGSGEGSQDGNRTATNPPRVQGAISAESSWISGSKVDSGSGYGSGISVNGGSWLNVMA